MNPASTVPGIALTNGQIPAASVDNENRPCGCGGGGGVGCVKPDVPWANCPHHGIRSLSRSKRAADEPHASLLVAAGGNTLHPLVGTIHYKDGYKIVMADVPGLIDGAAEE